MKTLLALCFAVAARAGADEEVARHRVTGLFSPEREADLRAVIERIPDVQLVQIDFAQAEATLRYDATKLFPNATPAQVAERLDKSVKAASESTFGIKPLSTIPRDRLTLLEIPVAGLDCKACALAAYEAVAKIDGVEQATASFRQGLVTALIDPTQTNRLALEEALKKKNVKVVTASAP